MEELIARIRMEGWRLTLEYLPSIDVFVCELYGSGRRAFTESKTMESALIDAIRDMDAL